MKKETPAKSKANSSADIEKQNISMKSKEPKVNKSNDQSKTNKFMPKFEDSKVYTDI